MDLLRLRLLLSHFSQVAEIIQQLQAYKYYSVDCYSHYQAYFCLKKDSIYGLDCCCTHQFIHVLLFLCDLLLCTLQSLTTV